jgi:hypothetical protein
MVVPKPMRDRTSRGYHPIQVLPQSRMATEWETHSRALLRVQCQFKSYLETLDLMTHLHRAPARRLERPGSSVPHISDMSWGDRDSFERHAISVHALIKLDQNSDFQLLMKFRKGSGLRADIVFDALPDPEITLSEDNGSNEFNTVASLDGCMRNGHASVPLI